MKKFNIENAIRTAEMIKASENSEITDNYIGDYIDADTAEEAIEMAMDYLAEQIRNNGYNADVTEDSIIVYDDNDAVVEEYYMFSAKEII